MDQAIPQGQVFLGRKRITYCLIRIIEHDLKLGRPIKQVIRILGSSLLTKDGIMELITPSEDEDKPDDGQLEIEFIYD